MRRLRQETITERIHSLRGIILLVSVPLILTAVLLRLMPRASDDHSMKDADALQNEDTRWEVESKRYAVIFDAGSSGSRVHVFCFNGKLDLDPIGDGLELFKQKKPGLSSYASNPSKGAESLNTLLEEALKVVPRSLQAVTPVKVGATAGLRALPGDTANELLQAVKYSLAQSSFKFSPSWVCILDGVQEGAYQWVTINYLLGFLGDDYRNTVGIVDLGGGSVQMAYAISKEAASSAPHSPEGEDDYVKALELLGKTYHVYVHSYLHYGLLAARSEILKLSQNSGCSCLPKGFHGDYMYGNELLKAISTLDGADFDGCHKLAVKVLKINQACNHMKCTFGGVWNGGGGDGQEKLFVASFFFDRAVQVGIIEDPDVLEAKVRASDFERMGNIVCKTTLTDMNTKFPLVPKENQAYICLDIVYQYTLLTTGFAIHPTKEITLVKKIKYKGFAVEAAWPLGSAIESLL